jgi:hypothetical protein
MTEFDIELLFGLQHLSSHYTRVNPFFLAGRLHKSYSAIIITSQLVTLNINFSGSFSPLVPTLTSWKRL